MSDTILTAEEAQKRIERYAGVAACQAFEALRQQVATLTEERDELREEAVRMDCAMKDYQRLYQDVKRDATKAEAERTAPEPSVETLQRRAKAKLDIVATLQRELAEARMSATKLLTALTAAKDELAEARAETWKLREVIGRANAAINRWTTDIDTTDAIPFICETLAPILAAPPAETKDAT